MTAMHVVGKSSFPLVGGKGDAATVIEGSQLMSAPEEEEDFDILNDETFGDGVDDGYDWEEEHERMAEEIDSFSFGDSKHNGNKTTDSGFDTAEKSYRTQEEYLEQSISQLVVDDEDELGDPAILNASKNRPIPQSHHKTCLEDLFGPSSPPAFLDTEHLVSPTSKDIWRVSRAEEEMNKQRNNAKQQPRYTVPTIIERRNIIPQSPMIPPQAHTLEEIEKRMMTKPRVVTAEELERQMRGDAAPRSQPQTPRTMPSGMMMPGQQFTPPVPIPHHPGQPGMIPPMQSHQSPYQRQAPVGSHLPQGFSPIAPLFPDGRNSPLHQMLAGRITPTGQLPGNMSPIPHIASRQSPVLGLHSNSPMGRSVTPPHPLRMSPLSHSPLQNRVMSSINHQQLIIGNGMSPNNRFNHNGMNMPQGPRGQGHVPGQYGSPAGPRMNPHQQFNDRYGNNQSASPGRNQFNKNQRFQGPNNYRDRQQRPYNNQRDRENRSGDDFAGLMTQREKDWIIKIQLMQLQTENPYIDDFYYTNFTLNKKNKELRRQQEENGVATEEQKLVIPHLVKIETKSYAPTQFEGSLGRLTTASVHNPRQIINVTRRSSFSGDDSMNVSKELRKIRQLLMEIERGYNLLLDIDDIEKQVLALTEESRKPLYENRSEKINELFNYVVNIETPDNFQQILSVRKGRKLVARLLPLLSSDQSEVLVSLIISHLPILVKKDSEDGTSQLCSSVNRAIGTSSLDNLIKYVDYIEKQYPVDKKSLQAVLQSKLGSTILCSLLKQGEIIYQKTSPVDMDNQLHTSWSQFVEKFVSSLAEVKLEFIAVPLQRQPSITKHIDRFINKKQIASIEDKLAVLTTSVPNQS
ncbi:hypothetical protein LOTGIDRAFT_168358 [Lottia gigantea]|uniref:mRNA decay factor PAT1 domain-containing protein n=1 Tax=Lottia gigantea TaxID=225164 RepID=V3Z2Q8_LOTGI|nr:hypothetical protein LOTGIDRAFT_168358 [Lottia gigantea]ESO84868.1 hypothetical protein LOTGIDRAFT_168358 [Lottia gigantea]